MRFFTPTTWKKVRSNRIGNENPVAAYRMPAVIKLEAGEFWWCSFGKSLNQPFCDGSYKETSFTPKKSKFLNLKILHFVTINILEKAPFLMVPTPPCPRLN